MAKEHPVVEQFTVRENGKEMIVVIPKSDDSSYDRQLKEAQIEKTKEQLRKAPKKPAPKISVKERSEALREFNRFRKRKQSEFPKRYF